MKKILLSIFMIIVTAGCFDKTPNCSDEIVKNEVIKLYRDHTIKELAEMDIEMALLMGLAGVDKKDLENKIKEFKTTKITIEHIRTTSIDKAIKRHSCLGTLKYQLDGESISEKISYSFQPTDDGKNIWIQIDSIE
ncbi:MAG: hypothetical protein K2N11_04340 [Mucispirillum sp.]|nr:hypothetical protein [Mucispirillum sp.]